MIWMMALALAAQENPVTGREALREIEPVMRQMLAEADNLWVHRSDFGSISIAFSTRPRATGFEGVCEGNRVLATMADPPATGRGATRRARLRQLTVLPEYYVLKGDAVAGTSNLSGDRLDTECAAVALPQNSVRIEADTPLSARTAVIALTAARRAVTETDSPLVRIECWTPGCEDRAELARRADPWSWYRVQYVPANCDDPGTNACLSISLRDNRLCGDWEILVESEWRAPERLRSVRFNERTDAMNHCGPPGGRAVRQPALANP